LVRSFILSRTETGAFRALSAIFSPAGSDKRPSPGDE
jgi:hypothetical protein